MDGFARVPVFKAATGSKRPTTTIAENPACLSHTLFLWYF